MTQRNQSKFVTDGTVDDPLEQGGRFEFDADDRQYIDNQIRGLQQHIIDNPGGASSDTAASVGTGASVYKTKAAGQFKFRTLEAPATQVASVVEDTNTIGLRPLPPGHYNVVDYYQSGDGADWAPAFRRALAAMPGASNDGGTLYVPPRTGGYALNSIDPDSPPEVRAAVVVNRHVTIKGAGSNGAYEQSMLVCDYGISGFFVLHPGGQFAHFEDLYIWSYLEDTRSADGLAGVRPLRIAGHAYTVGQTVRCADELRFYWECKTAGTSDAGLTGYEVFIDPGVDHLITSDYPDGTATWRIRFHAAIVTSTKITAERCTFSNFGGAGLVVAGGSAANPMWSFPSNANDCQFDKLSFGGCGTGPYLVGIDANGCTLTAIQVSAAGGGQSGIGGHGIVESSFLGNTYIAPQIESGTGRGIWIVGGAVAQNTFVGGEIEGSLQPNKFNATALRCGGYYANGDEAGFTGYGSWEGRAHGIQVYDDTGGLALEGLTDPQNGTSLFSMKAGLDPQFLRWSWEDTWSGGGGGSWAHKWGSNLPAYFVTGKPGFPTWDPGYFGVPVGMIMGNPTRGEQLWIGTHDSLHWSTDVRGGLRKRGDRFLRGGSSIAYGCYAAKTPTSDGAHGPLWTALTGGQGYASTYSSASTIEPSTNDGSGGQAVFQCVNTTTGITGAVEPVWSTAPNPGDQLVDGGVTWERMTATTPYPGLIEKIESPTTAYTPQTTQLWKDSADTVTTAAKVRERKRRRQAQTTTATANQVLDDGGTFGLEDFTLVDNAITRIEALLLVKKSATAAGGTIRMSADYYRNSAGAPTIIGAATITYNLTGTTLDATTANFNVNGNKVEIRVSPESADTLNWAIFRTQSEGTD